MLELNRDMSTICVYLQTYGEGGWATPELDYCFFVPFSDVLLASGSEVSTWFKVYNISIIVSANSRSRPGCWFSSCISECAYRKKNENKIQSIQAFSSQGGETQYSPDIRVFAECKKLHQHIFRHKCEA